MTTSEMLEQIEIELFLSSDKFGFMHAGKWADMIADEQEFLAEVREYERTLLSNRAGIKGDRIA